MIFSAPIFLYLLPSAGLPVLFHFFLKQKKRQLLFPTLMFFYRTDPKLNSRRKIHQLLLLLMRVLLILLILLGLSRPRFQSAMQMGGRISVVAVVDNSGSMSDLVGNERTKLELAVDGAKRLISALGESAKMSVVTLVEDSAATFGDSLTSDRESLLSGLDGMEPTHATGNAGRVLARAFKLIQSDSAAGGVVHVFSDLQESEWDADALPAELAGAPIHVYLHRIESKIRQQANVAISSVQFPRQKILPKHPLNIGVVCRNNSGVTANIRLNSIDNQGNKNTQVVVLEPGRSQIVEVGTNPNAPGYHWLRTWLEGDGFAADNEAGIGIFCEQTAAVLFGGSPEDFGVLPTALSPDQYGQFTGMTSTFGRIDQIPQAVSERPILTVTTWQEIGSINQDSSALRDYVEKGGNLLIVPSLKITNAKGQTPAWIGADTKMRSSYPRGMKIEVLEQRSGFWNRIREATGEVSLDNVSVFTFYPLELSEGCTALFGIDSERVIFAHRKLGEGNIYLSGTAFDPRWNTLPLTGLIVVMAQSIALEGTAFDEDTMLALVAGERPEGIDASGGQLEVLSLVGDPIDFSGRMNEMPAFPKSGVYLIRSPDKEQCVSVRSSEKEGVEKFLKGSQSPALAQIAHTIVDYDPTEGLQKYHYGQSRTVELYLPVVLLATLALLAEGWLANPIRARAQETKPSESPVTAEPMDISVAEPEREVPIGRGAG